MDAGGPRDNHEEFVALFVRHEAAIHSFILTLLPRLDDAEDVMQQASLTMWRKFNSSQAQTSAIGRFRSPSSPP
jgi:RNA polymerase sigma-70 factor (ECF subfamily)